MTQHTSTKEWKSLQQIMQSKTQIKTSERTSRPQKPNIVPTCSTELTSVATLETEN